jgi:hypothetical protein
MHEGHPDYTVVDGRVVGTREANRQVALPDEIKVWVINVISQALADDKAHGAEWLFLQAGLDFFGTEHECFSDVRKHYIDD